jgi:BTB/POZ domain
MTISSTEIQKYIQSDPPIHKQFASVAVGYSGGRKDLMTGHFAWHSLTQQALLEDITSVANAIFTLAQSEARRRKTRLTLTPESVINPSLHASVKEIIPLNESVEPIITAIFKNLYNIEITITWEEYHYRNYVDSLKLSWDKDNPFLKPKPSCNVSTTQISRDSYFVSLMKDDSLSDIQLTIEGKIIKTHRLILAQCPYFHALLKGPWKDRNSSIEPIAFQQCSYDTFLNFLEYLYTGKISDVYSNKSENCLTMFRFADYMGYQPLQTLSKSHIFKLINEQNFFDIALMLTQIFDIDLDKLCKWFVHKHPKCILEVDVSSMTLLQILMTYKIGKSYGIKSLIKKSVDEFENKMLSYDCFIELCESIKEDRPLKLALMEILRKELPPRRLNVYWDAMLSSDWKI